jgi:hypothetical protein
MDKDQEIEWWVHQGHHAEFCVIERCQADSAYRLHKTRHGVPSRAVENAL